MSEATSPTLSAVLIVKDEAAQIVGCIESVRALVDKVYVHDTGSSDDTVTLAQRAGAIVSTGAWSDDFAAARNAATALADTEWVLSVDADERVVADATALREVLRTTPAAALRILMTVEHELPYDFVAVRLFRPLAARWAGRVHEQLVARAGSLDVGDVAPDVFRMSHSGYATAEQRGERAARNAAIARLTIEKAPRSDEDRIALARSYVDLGRSYVAMGRSQDAADAFEEVRSRFPGTPEWVEATDFFTRLLIAESMHNEVLAITQQLSEAGASTKYCDWLASQALVQLGRYREAHELLANVDEVRDTSGRIHSAEALAELKDLVDKLYRLNPEQ